jgi:hypothetical protein
LKGSEVEGYPKEKNTRSIDGLTGRIMPDHPLIHRVLAIAALSCGLQACTGFGPAIPVHTEWAGQEINTTVDSEIAEYYLKHYLAGDHARPEFDSAIGKIEASALDPLPSRTFLKTVAQRYSTDLAALILWQKVIREPGNEAMQRVFAEELSKIRAGAGVGAPSPLMKTDYLILFVPGWFYKSQPENGADFARPRRVLAEAGARAALLGIEENGAVERNADLIAGQIVELSRREEKIILVSASKAGPEVALALTQLRQTGLSHSVKAWVNIGGTLRGSILADKAVTWPACWFVKLFVIGGGSFDGLESLTTERSTERASRISLPPDVPVVNYVGIPLSGQVSGRARLGYSLLREEGPNDGLTQIVDEIPSGSRTIAELGLDHFFDGPDIHLKTVALARTVIRSLEDRATMPLSSGWEERAP